MSKYTVDDTSLTVVAGAIRDKGGTSSPLAFPQGFVDAIGDIQTGVVTLKPHVLRPDAELIETYSDDQWLVEDAGIELPAYSTTAKTLKASANLTPTIKMDYTAYDYYVVERTLAIPAYSADTKAKGRNEFFASGYLYEIIDIPANSFVADGGKAITSRTVAAAGQGLVRMLYWSSATAIALYTATTYGIAMGVTAPEISSGVLKIKSPTWLIRGNTTYLTSAMWALLTDIRFQYVIEVYRAPKANLNIDGWGTTQNYLHILGCKNADGKLT